MKSFSLRVFVALSVCTFRLAPVWGGLSVLKVNSCVQITALTGLSPLPDGDKIWVKAVFDNDEANSVSMPKRTYINNADVDFSSSAPLCFNQKTDDITQTIHRPKFKQSVRLMINGYAMRGVVSVPMPDKTFNGGISTVTAKLYTDEALGHVSAGTLTFTVFHQFQAEYLKISQRNWHTRRGCFSLYGVCLLQPGVESPSCIDPMPNLVMELFPEDSASNRDQLEYIQSTNTIWAPNGGDNATRCWKPHSQFLLLKITTDVPFGGIRLGFKTGFSSDPTQGADLLPSPWFSFGFSDDSSNAARITDWQLWAVDLSDANMWQPTGGSNPAYDINPLWFYKDTEPGKNGTHRFSELYKGYIETWNSARITGHYQLVDDTTVWDTWLSITGSGAEYNDDTENLLGQLRHVACKQVFGYNDNAVGTVYPSNTLDDCWNSGVSSATCIGDIASGGVRYPPMTGLYIILSDYACVDTSPTRVSIDNIWSLSDCTEPSYETCSLPDFPCDWLQHSYVPLYFECDINDASLTQQTTIAPSIPPTTLLTTTTETPTSTTETPTSTTKTPTTTTETPTTTTETPTTTTETPTTTTETPTSTTLTPTTTTETPTTTTKTPTSTTETPTTTTETPTSTTKTPTTTTKTPTTTETPTTTTETPTTTTKTPTTTTETPTTTTKTPTSTTETPTTTTETPTSTTETPTTTTQTPTSTTETPTTTTETPTSTTETPTTTTETPTTTTETPTTTTETPTSTTETPTTTTKTPTTTTETPTSTTETPTSTTLTPTPTSTTETPTTTTETPTTTTETPTTTTETPTTTTETPTTTTKTPTSTTETPTSTTQTPTTTTQTPTTTTKTPTTTTETPTSTTKTPTSTTETPTSTTVTPTTTTQTPTTTTETPTTTTETPTSTTLTPTSTTETPTTTTATPTTTTETPTTTTKTPTSTTKTPTTTTVMPTTTTPMPTTSSTETPTTTTMTPTTTTLIPTTTTVLPTTTTDLPTATVLPTTTSLPTTSTSKLPTTTVLTNMESTIANATSTETEMSTTSLLFRTTEGGGNQKGDSTYSVPLWLYVATGGIVFCLLASAVAFWLHSRKIESVRRQSAEDLRQRELEMLEAQNRANGPGADTWETSDTGFSGIGEEKPAELSVDSSSDGLYDAGVGDVNTTIGERDLSDNGKGEGEEGVVVSKGNTIGGEVFGDPAVTGGWHLEATPEDYDDDVGALVPVVAAVAKAAEEKVLAHRSVEPGKVALGRMREVVVDTVGEADIVLDVLMGDSDVDDDCGTHYGNSQVIDSEFSTFLDFDDVNL